MTPKPLPSGNYVPAFAAFLMVQWGAFTAYLEAQSNYGAAVAAQVATQITLSKATDALNTARQTINQALADSGDPQAAIDAGLALAGLIKAVNQANAALAKANTDANAAAQAVNPAWQAVIASGNPPAVSQGAELV